jgi:hypothetical protein
MNDWAAYAVLGRMLERLLVVAFAGLGVYLGYRLFLQIPDYKDAQGEIKLPAMNMSVTFSRVGPGVFFAIFGVAVLLASYLHPITVEPPKGSPAATGEEAGSAGFQGATPTQEEQERSLNRVVVAHMMASLNGLQAVISQDPRLGNEDGTTIRDTKLVIAKGCALEIPWRESRNPGGAGA